MINIYECQIARSDILELTVLNNSIIAYATKLHGINLFDYHDGSIVDTITNTYLSSEVTVSAFSPNNEMFAFVNNHNIHVLDMKSKKIIQSIETDNEEIEILSFDASSKYILAGTSNARVLQYKYNSSSVLARLCSFPHEHSSTFPAAEYDKKYVSSFAFYDNYFACSGFGGAIYIIDLRLQTTRVVIQYARSRIDALCFLDEDTIVAGNNSGEVYIISLNDTKNFKRVSTSLPCIKQIILMQNPNYIMVAGNGSAVSIIDVKKHKIAHSKYVELDSNIRKIVMIGSDYLIVALNNRSIQNIELPSEAKLRSLIQNGFIEKAYELISKEPMLEGSYEHKMLDEKFHRAYMDATKSLIEQDKDKALKTLSIYKSIRSKQPQIRELFDAFKNYKNFQLLFKEEKYALVYAISSKFEPLKHTPEFIKTEHIFKTAFSNAQKLVLQGNTDDARFILGKYATVMSKRPIIKMILTQTREFVSFLKAVQNKDFKKVEELITINELFMQVPTYTSLIDEIENKLKEINSNIQSGDVTAAREELSKLEDVTHIKERVQILQTQCRDVERLYAAYNSDDFKFCYKILDSHKWLGTTQLGILLENHWSKIMNQCEEFALNGNIKDIKKTLGDLITLPSRLNRVGDLIRVSFHVKIEQLISKRNYPSAEAIIYSYVDIFGLDNEIVQIMKSFEKNSGHKLAITQTQKDRPSRDSWIHSEIVIKKPHH